MSWWSSLSNASKLASTALKEAQKKIDKVLDIDEENSGLGNREFLYDLEGNVYFTEKSAEEAVKKQDETHYNAETEHRDNDICSKQSDFDILESGDPSPQSEFTLPPKFIRSQCSSLSSGPMPDLKYDFPIAVARPSTPCSYIEPTESVSLPRVMGDTYSVSDMSTSGTIAAEPQHSPSSSSLHAYKVENGEQSNDQPRTDLAEPSDDCIQSMGDEFAASPFLSTSPVSASQPLQQPPNISSTPLQGPEEDACTTSSEIEVISGCTSVNDEPMVDQLSSQNGKNDKSRHIRNASGSYIPCLPFDFHSSTDKNYEVVCKKLMEALELVEARETKLVELSRTNLSLQEVNQYLHAKLEEVGFSHDFSPDQNISTLIDEFTDMEKKLREISLERDLLRAQLSNCSGTNTDDKVLKLRCLRLEEALSVKETQVTELLQEGNRMAQDQLQTNNLVKKLRAKEKTNEGERLTLSNSLIKAQSELELLKSEIISLREQDSNHLSLLNQYNRQIIKLENDLATTKVDLGLAKENTESLQKALLLSNSKCTEQSEALDDLRAEMKLVSEKLFKFKAAEVDPKSAHNEVVVLKNRLQEVTLSGYRLKREWERTLQQSLQEVTYYRTRLADAEMRLESVDETSSAVAKPLIRQIEQLQNTIARQTHSWEITEQTLRNKIGELQSKVSSTESLERGYQESLKKVEEASESIRNQLTSCHVEINQLREKLSAFSSEIRIDKEQIAKLQNDLDASNQRLAESENTNETSQSELTSRSCEIERLQLELSNARQEIKDLTSKTEIQLISSRVEDSLCSQNKQFQTPLSIPETDLLLSSPQCCTGMNGESVYSLKSSVQFANSVTYLQSQIQQRDGEMAQLRREILRLTETHESLLLELTSQTEQTERFARLAGLPLSTPSNPGRNDAAHDDYLSSLAVADPCSDTVELERRYSVLLQLYGERMEEVNELRLDLSEAKEAYKSQLNELLEKFNK